MKVYCRIQGLQGENGKKYNGRVGEIIEADDDFDIGGGGHDAEAGEDDEAAAAAAARRVGVRVDGEWNPKSFKLKNLKILSDSDSTTKKVQHYTFSCSFDPANPHEFRFAASSETMAGSGSNDAFLAGGGKAPNHACNLQMILMALKGYLSKILFNTPTVIHLSDLNASIGLNKLLAGETDFLKTLPEYIVSFLKDVVTLLQKNPLDTFAKFTPNQDMGTPAWKDEKKAFAGDVYMGMDGSMIKPLEDKTDDVEGTRDMANFPAQYAFFPPLATRFNTYYDYTVELIDPIFKGIYHIYPNRSIENCYDVIYAGDGEHTIQMASFMNMGLSSITEWFHFTGALGDTDRRVAQYCLAMEPGMFWNILLNFEEYREKEVRQEPGLFMVLPYLAAAPANNRKLLKKRATAKDEEMGLLLPQGNRSYSSVQEREQVSDRHARIGAILCMIELGIRRKRTPSQGITLEVARHLAGADLDKDMEAAFGHINNGEYQQAAQVLNGGRICGCCGISDAEAVLSTCGACKMVDYCSRECQKKDYKPKHRKICGALGEERNGNPPVFEKNYGAHMIELAPQINQIAQGHY